LVQKKKQTKKKQIGFMYRGIKITDIHLEINDTDLFCRNQNVNGNPGYMEGAMIAAENTVKAILKL
jgi:alanine-alpha-ketoisovalerate/valine-pyruvate aminotransferase